MSKLYRVSLTKPNGRVEFSETRKRRDAAALMFERQLYRVLEAFGQLDTKLAHKEMSYAHALYKLKNPTLNYLATVNGYTIEFECIN